MESNKASDNVVHPSCSEYNLESMTSARVTSKERRILFDQKGVVSAPWTLE